MKGEGAPQDCHPDTIAKESCLRINWSQRTPRQSQEIKENPERYAVLKIILADILRFIHDNVSLTHL